MKLTLIGKKKETPHITTFLWKPEQKIEWVPGQFLHYTLPHDDPDERGIERWFTIAAAPFEGHIQISTRYTDSGSSFKKKLFSLHIGETIEADGVEGDFTLDDPAKTSVFIAGGIGITPFRSILLDLDHREIPIRVKLLYSNHNDNFPFRNELDLLAERHPYLTIHYCSRSEPMNERFIMTHVNDLVNPIFFLSGPAPMVQIYETMLLDMGIEIGRVKHDKFPGYRWDGTGEN